MKRFLVLLVFSLLAICVNAQSQKAWAKEFERLDIPADIKNHNLTIYVHDSPKNLKDAIEEMMQEYKGKWTVKRYKESDGGWGEYKAALLGGSGGFFINFDNVNDPKLGKYTRIQSITYKNVMKHFITWLNER